MTQVTANGNTYSDDGSTLKDMRNGGFRTWLLAMLSDVMAVILTALSAVRTLSPNLLINGGMEIDQANEGASVALSSGVAAYGPDGFQVLYVSAATGVTVQRVADAPAGASNSLKITVGTGAAVGATDYLIIRQPIEAQELAEIGLGAAGALNLPVSVAVKSSIGSYVFSIALTNYAGTRYYPLNATIVNSGTWQTITAIIPGDVTGTWVTSGTAGGAYLVIGIAVGSNFQGLPTAWGAGNAYGTATNTNTILSTNGATFQVTKAKLEIGPSNTPFVRESFATALARCQRYYEKSYNLGVVLGSLTPIGQSLILGQAMGTTAGVTDRFKVTKRTTPTVVVASAGSGTAARALDYVAGADVVATINHIGASGFDWSASPTSGSNVQLGLQWLADARL